MNGLLITPAGWSLVEFGEESFLEDARRHLGCKYVELVAAGEECVCWLDEHAKLGTEPMVPNALATALLMELLRPLGRQMIPGDVIINNALFTGLRKGDDGSEPDNVTEAVVQKLIHISREITR